MTLSSAIIVGGGVAGLAMANALAVRGVSSIVLEKTKAPGDVDRGDVIHHVILELFRRWGILELLQKYGALKFTNFRILNQKGATVFRIDLAQQLNPGATFTVLRHPDIERLLEEAAVATGRVSVLRNMP